MVATSRHGVEKGIRLLLRRLEPGPIHQHNKEVQRRESDSTNVGGNEHAGLSGGRGSVSERHPRARFSVTTVAHRT